MDASIVNVSLVTIAESLDSDISGVRWIVLIYLLTITSLIGIGGALGDTYGRKKVFQSGMILFTIGSILCSISPSLYFLIASRAVQAIGAAAIQANGLAIVIYYIRPEHRGRAIGINSLVVASALSVGPVLGGILTELYGWPSIFLINIPIGIIGVIAVHIYINETRRKEGEIDYRGMILFAYTAFAFICGILFAFDGYPLAILFTLSSLFTAYKFYKVEEMHPNPMVSISIIKDRQIIAGVLAAIFCYMSINSIIFLLPFYLQEILLLSQSETGVVLVAVPLALILTGVPAGFLAERIKARRLATFGAVIQSMMIGIIGLLLLTIQSDLRLGFLMLLIGITTSFLAVFTNSNGTSVMNAAPHGSISIVAGAVNLSRNIGFVLGTALSSLFFSLFFEYLNPNNYKSGPKFENAYYSALGITFIIFAAFNFIGVTLSMLRGKERVELY